MGLERCDVTCRFHLDFGLRDDETRCRLRLDLRLIIVNFLHVCTVHQ